ncbi:Cof-type HAD-IIB family hydrolase [Bacillus solimangrovi]|uniref:Haloacid dehalogenase n=1 Tax=Bacillus solimangrovi TaxID=1305675 RepID=A0A1E5LG27_9BACI|nr:Cof-type HAD-IIB family hydrolase [Bacillus solimangrovi]OEH93006.1 haloacid dehalogenase [Bacillus solimangrovi]
MKVIAIDLDGTLLLEDESIDEENIKAIKHVQEQGDIVSVATGRALLDVQHITNKYGLSMPIIASNGAQIYIDNHQVQEQVMSNTAIQPIIKWLNDEKMYYQIYLSDKIVVHEHALDYLEEQLFDVVKRNPNFHVRSFWDAIRAQRFQYGLQKVEKPIQPTSYDQVIKIMVVSPDVIKLNLAKSYFSMIDGCAISSSGTFNIEIMKKGVDKGSALQYLCEYCKVPEKNTMAIGDNENDIPMFLVAGTGIAMENATESLIKHASSKTLSNDQSGVAHALYHYLHKDKIVIRG